MRVVVALGGNAMTSPDGLARPCDQQAAIGAAMEALAGVVAAGHDVVITHGNGPQVGNLLVKNEMAATVVPPVPLDWCGAQTQGTIGFTVVTALEASLRRRGIERPVAALVTRTRVDAQDPGLSRPTKPIGRYLPADEAAVLVAHGQTWADRGERGWRRMVASPEPLEVLDAPAVDVLMARGFLVVAAGGGGIPVVTDDGSVRGVEAVIDKDLTAALLACHVGADVLVIATDVDHAVLGFGSDTAASIERVTPGALRGYAAQGQFSGGSMGPKVEAAARFVESGGRRAVITSLRHIEAAVAGAYGTVVEPDPVEPT